MAIDKGLLATYTTSDGLALADLVRRKEVSAAELVECAVTRIEALNPRLNAVVHRLYDMGRAAAASVDTNAPFAGVPFLLKELVSSWAGAPMTDSSVYLKDVVADTDSVAVERIKAAGFALVGKSNSPEMGWSISTEPKLYGATQNPWQPGITPGGSSGGTAAAVAARMVPIGEASDGAGSIRVPASCCGVVGLKPSRGRVTLAPGGDFWFGGTYTLCNSITVRDTAAYLDALAGGLVGDPYTPPTPNQSWLELSRQSPAKLRVGYTVTPNNGTAIDAQVKAAVLATVAQLESAGHIVEEHDMPLDGDSAWRIYTRMTTVETALAFDALAQVVGREVTADLVEPLTWSTIERGRSLQATQLAEDTQNLRVLGRDVAIDLHPYDVYITPTLTQLPRPMGFYDMSMTDLDAYNALWADACFMFPFNFSGLPAMSLPLGWSSDAVPIGVQLVGRYGDEATVLAVATQLETAMPWRERRPPGV